MVDATKLQAPKRRWFWRVLAWSLVVLLVLLIAAYFVGTSSAFVKAYVLPRVGKSLNAEITVSEASIHPFSQVTLRDLKVQPNGAETLLTAKEIRTHYSLFDIIRGNIKLEEVAMTSPLVHLVENPDGTSNLDPLLKKEKETGKAPHPKEPSKKTSEPPQIDLAKLSLSNATIRKEKLYAGNRRDVLELSGVNVTVSNLKNGDSGKLSLSASILLNNNPPPPGSNALLQATVDGNYLFALSPELRPQSIKGQSRMKVSRAEGSFQDLATMGATLDCDLSPREITQVALRFQKSGNPLGQLLVAGPFDSEKLEGRLKVQLLAIDRRILNLIGAASGVDFGTTTINSTNEILLANSGKSISATGQFNADNVQLIRTNQTTPTLAVHAGYNVTVNQGENNATIRSLTLNGTQNGRPLLGAELASPMSVSWGGAAATAGDSSLNLIVTNLNLADWKPFLGNAVSEGHIDLNLGLKSQQGGKQLAIRLTSQLANIAPVGGDKKLTSALINADLTTLLADKENSVKGALALTNMVVNDPSGAIPATPLEARLQLDASLQKNVADLRQLQIGLTPTSRAQNQLQLQGRVDLSQPGAIAGELKIVAESLDLTSYYDLFSAGSKSASVETNAPPKTKSKSKRTPTKPSEEPPAQQLPVQHATMQVNINHLYLREVEVTNFQTALDIQGSHIVLKPLQFALNGAPVRAAVDLDLGVPGYRYQLSFDAQHVPFAPLVDTFVPERKGELGGSLTARTEISGAGITGASLQKNLTGQFDFGTTNLNLAVENVRSPVIRLIINVVSTIPELLHNPGGTVEGTLGSVVGALTGNKSSGQGGLTGELSKSPIDVIATSGKAGDGRIELQNAAVRSPVFEASTHGVVALASELNDSKIDFPISVSLSRPVAERINLVPANTPTNAAYVPLPDFLKIGGTIGKPTRHVNALALAGTALKTLDGIPGTNVKPGGLLKDLGGVLTGRAPATNASPATNTDTNTPAATNPLPVGNLLDKLLKPKTDK